jgi:hypothetical protein
MLADSYISEHIALHTVLYTNKSWVQCAEPAIIYINLAVFRLIFN